MYVYYVHICLYIYLKYTSQLSYFDGKFKISLWNDPLYLSQCFLALKRAFVLSTIILGFSFFSSEHIFILTIKIFNFLDVQI